MTRGVAGLKEARSHLAGQRARSLQRVEGQGKRGGLDGPLPDGEQARLAPIASRQQGVRPADVNSQNGCYPRHGPVTIGSAAEPKSQLAARGHPRQAKRCDRTTRSGTTRAASPTIGSPSITAVTRLGVTGGGVTICDWCAGPRYALALRHRQRRQSRVRGSPKGVIWCRWPRLASDYGHHPDSRFLAGWLVVG